MTTVISLDVGTIAREMESRIKIGINKGLVVLLDELKRLTPEDTKNMLNSYVVKQAQVDGNSVIGEISNSSEYAIYVERGRGLTFKYHKPKGNVFYKGIGNRTFARAVDNTRLKIEQIILSELNR